MIKMKRFFRKSYQGNKWYIEYSEENPAIFAYHYDMFYFDIGYYIETNNALLEFSFPFSCKPPKGDNATKRFLVRKSSKQLNMSKEYWELIQADSAQNAFEFFNSKLAGPYDFSILVIEVEQEIPFTVWPSLKTSEPIKL